MRSSVFAQPFFISLIRETFINFIIKSALAAALLLTSCGRNANEEKTAKQEIASHFIPIGGSLEDCQSHLVQITVPYMTKRDVFACTVDGSRAIVFGCFSIKPSTLYSGACTPNWAETKKFNDDLRSFIGDRAKKLAL